MTPVLIALVATLAVGAAAWTFVARVRAKREEARAALEQKLAGRRVLARDDRALYFGLGSRGGRQLRGNGCLAATDEEILFEMWVPRRSLSISRARVLAVEGARAHAGKTIGFELVRVRFREPDGREESAAWATREPGLWLSALRT